jgi:hypothetical protein
VPDDEAVEPATEHYPAAAITPAEFERFVVDLLGCSAPIVDGLDIRLHDRITGVDGTYDFDATVRFSFGGMNFLVVVEAKRHKNPIKRELVQVLHSKMASVGAQKAAMVSTAPYQCGAVDYAKIHGIALARVTEGRYMFETKTAGPTVAMSREEARIRFGLPTFAAVVFGAADTPDATLMSALTTREPAAVAEELLGIRRPEEGE